MLVRVMRHTVVVARNICNTPISSWNISDLSSFSRELLLWSIKNASVSYATTILSGRCLTVENKRFFATNKDRCLFFEPSYKRKQR